MNKSEVAHVNARMHEYYTGPFKLVSQDGMLLGTFSVPNHVAWEMATSLGEGRKATRIILQDMNAFALPNYMSPKSMPDVSTERMFMLDVSFHGNFYGQKNAYIAYGITPDELEILPGWTFTPSLAYIRSLLA